MDDVRITRDEWDRMQEDLGYCLSRIQNLDGIVQMLNDEIRLAHELIEETRQQLRALSRQYTVHLEDHPGAWGA